MKRITLWIVLMSISICGISQVVDSAFIRIEYETYSKEFADNDKIDEDWFYLDAGRGHSQYYSAYRHSMDSVRKSVSSKGLSAEEIFEKTRGMKQGSEENIFKSYGERQLTYFSRVLIQRYYYEEELPDFGWELSRDTLTVSKYLCYKATCRFRGREWTAWYTPEIPVMDGPWKLSGLPGLILMAGDGKGEFRFICRGVKQTKIKTPIALPLAESKNKFVKTDAKSFMQLSKKSMEDINATLAVSGARIVSVTDEKGKETGLPVRKLNPIEYFE